MADLNIVYLNGRLVSLHTVLKLHDNILFCLVTRYYRLNSHFVRLGVSLVRIIAKYNK